VAVVGAELLVELEKMVHPAVVVAEVAVLLLVEKVFTLAQLILMRLDKDMTADVAEILDLVTTPEGGAVPVVLVQVKKDTQEEHTPMAV
jgi:hypothetical protein